MDVCWVFCANVYCSDYFLFIHAGNACPRVGVLKDVMLNESYFNLNQV